MQEKIYTIPVNDGFLEKSCCAICRIYESVEQKELERILGASMMEPDVRIKTNERGFCRKHFDRMLTMKNRLGLALMLESHIDEIIHETFDGTKGFLSKIPDVKKQENILAKREKSCYVCERIDNYMNKIIETIYYLYKNDKAFIEKIKVQEGFCLHHFRRLLNGAEKKLTKREAEDFCKLINEIEENYLKTLLEDVSWFCKKFDYRYDKEDWKNSKDAPDRAVKTLKKG